MKNKKVVIRADGNSKIGLGHIYRGIALAHMLKNDFDIGFIIRTDSDILPFMDLNFNYTYLPAKISITDEPSWFKENYSSENTILILDGYYFDEKYQKKIKEYNFKLVYIDDLVSFHQYADIVINHSLGIKEEDYSAEPYTKFALGSDYALLRPSFLEAAKQNRKISKIDTAFVCFGGANPFHLTEKALKALLSFPQLEKIYVLVGTDYKLYEISKLNKTKKRIIILQNLNGKELFETISKCNFAITSASTILYELFAVKIPILSGYYVDNQIKYYNGIKDMGMIINADNLANLEIQDYIVLIKGYLDNFNPNKIVNKQHSFIDGKSGERIIKLINEIC